MEESSFPFYKYSIAPLLVSTMRNPGNRNEVGYIYLKPLYLELDVILELEKNLKRKKNSFRYMYSTYVISHPAIEIKGSDLPKSN